MLLIYDSIIALTQQITTLFITVYLVQLPEKTRYTWWFVTVFLGLRCRSIWTAPRPCATSAPTATCRPSTHRRPMIRRVTHWSTCRSYSDNDIRNASRKIWSSGRHS
ncbi:MAG: hypothetical protein ACLFVO_05435 [Chloroflexaceae bacterium]